MLNLTHCQVREPTNFGALEVDEYEELYWFYITVEGIGFDPGRITRVFRDNTIVGIVERAEIEDDEVTLYCKLLHDPELVLGIEESIYPITVFLDHSRQWVQITTEVES